MKHLCSDEPRLTAVPFVPRVWYTLGPRLTHQMPGTSFPFAGRCLIWNSPHTPQPHVVPKRRSQTLALFPNSCLLVPGSPGRAHSLLEEPFYGLGFPSQPWLYKSGKGVPSTPFGPVPSKQLVEQGEKPETSNTSTLSAARNSGWSTQGMHLPTQQHSWALQVSGDPEGATQQRKKHLERAWKIKLVKSSIHSTPRLPKPGNSPRMGKISYQ